MSAFALSLVTLACRMAIGVRIDLLSEPVGPVGHLPAGSSWVDAKTRKLARTELAQCVDPDVEPQLTGAPQWLPPLQAAAKDYSGSSHVETVWKPPESLVEPHFGWRLLKWVSDRIAPWHRAAVTNSDTDTYVPPEMDYPTARCYQFNYSDSGPDPYGCSPFKKSFSMLQLLRQCIHGKLEQSRRWLMYREVGKLIMLTRRGHLDWNISLLDTVDPQLHLDLDPNERTLLNGIKANMSDGWKTRVIFDANLRADEMVKYAALEDWATLTNEGLISYVQRKIRETITEVTLEEDLIEEIRHDCFQVDVDFYSALPAGTKALRRAMPCVPLMWDSIAVGDLPHKPISEGVTLWDESQRSPPEVKLNLPSTPPVCGRIALGLMKRPLIYAPKGYSRTACLVGQARWKKCMSLRHFNCACFEKCWVRALMKACKVAEGCCSDYKALHRYDALFR